MKIKFYSVIAAFFLTGFIFSQEKDSIYLGDIQTMKTVVLTGQHNPQSIDKSVFEVEVISQQDIRNLAGNNLSDVLNQNLNLNIIPNAGEGRAGIEQFGFNSEYVKILVDGVPIVGDEGFGNAIDISQISLDDIQQIEIVEGSMGVQYGDNAVTGVVNIITKKRSHYNWEISPYIQEETAGDEYGLFGKGRHIQSLKIAHNFSDHWNANVHYLHNDFQGYLGHLKGKNYYNPDKDNDLKRGYEWLPKEQHDIKGLVQYTKNDFRAFYKFEYFNEQTDKYAQKIRLNPNNATETVNPTASDNIFRSERFYHHLNATGKLFHRLNFNLSASYQEQTRNLEEYTYHLKTGDKTNTNRFDYNTRKGFFSRGTLNNFLDLDKVNLELGYVLKTDKGIGSGLAEQDQSNNSKENYIDTYSGFFSGEIKATERFSLRPGIRVLGSSQFSTQTALSFSGKYRFKNNYQLRAIVGTSPKTPNFEQLYFYLVDSNHDVRGNADLAPEKGKSIFLHFKKNFDFDNAKLSYIPKLSAWYLDVKDKIDLTIVDMSPLAYEYNNIDLYRTWGLALRNKLNYSRLMLDAGFSFSGESKKLNSEDKTNDDYLYSFQANVKLSYRLPKWRTTLSTFFKYNGKEYQYVSGVDSNGDATMSKQKQEGYGWWDATVRKSFLDKRFEVTLGARNLLDIKSIRTVGTSDNGHSSGRNSLRLGYGTSYFMKLKYNLNF